MLLGKLFFLSVLLSLSGSCASSHHKDLKGEKPSSSDTEAPSRPSEPTKKQPETEPTKKQPKTEKPSPVISNARFILGPIPTLPSNWWMNQNTVWTVWQQDTYYLWGANKGNYRIFDPHQSLSGSGMASPTGPSRGRGHPHYRGVITTDLADTENDEVFNELKAHLEKGNALVVPTLKGKWALGSGVAVNKFNNKDWLKSQKYLLSKVAFLASICGIKEFPQGSYWANCLKTDCSNKSLHLGDPHTYALQDFSSFSSIISAIDKELGN